MRALKYLAFFVAVFAFMVFARFEESLSPDENLALSQFQTQVSMENENASVVASEEPTPGNTISANSTYTSSIKPNGYILEDSVNIRTGPSLDFPVVTQLYKWDEVALGTLTNGWYEIFLNGETLYVSSDFATLSPFQ